MNPNIILHNQIYIKLNEMKCHTLSCENALGQEIEIRRIIKRSVPIVLPVKKWINKQLYRWDDDDDDEMLIEMEIIISYGSLTQKVAFWAISLCMSSVVTLVRRW